MKLLILGLPRTGTTSLCLALAHLGLSPYNYYELLKNKEKRHFQLWLSAIDAKFSSIGTPFQREDFDLLLSDYDTVAASPGWLFADELLTAYPDAKVILTTRPPELWLKSMRQTTFTELSWRSMGLICFVNKSVALHWRLFNRVYFIMSQGQPPWEKTAHKPLLDFYERHNDYIRSVVPKHNLLEYSPGDGWDRLCEFLEVAKPPEEFPHVNEKDNFVSAAKAVYWSLWGRIIAMLLTAVVVALPLETALERWKQNDSQFLQAAARRQMVLRTELRRRTASARMVDPIIFCSIFPYIAAMVHRNTHLPVSDVGFYSGLIESVFAIVQTIAVVIWSKLSDKMGRKPALVCSLLGTAAGSSLFGMATILWQMFLFRCISGFFAASNLITRTIIAECVASEAQAQAFGWLVFAANAGNFVGPIIGGALADPATQYPSLFGDIPWLKDNPYALAGIAVGAIFSGIAVLCTFWLQETKEAALVGSATVPSQKKSLARLIKSPGIPVTLGVYVHSKVLAIATSAVLPVYLFTPVSLGGMELSTVHISIFMAIQGGGQVLWLLLAFPFFNGRLGTKRLLTYIATLWPFTFAGYILVNTMLRSTNDAAHQWLWMAIVPAVVLIGSAVIMSQTSVQLAINDVSPSPEYLAMINALALVGNGVVRAVTPGVSSAVYAFGVRNQFLQGHLAWVVLILLSLAFRALVPWLPSLA